MSNPFMQPERESNLVSYNVEDERRQLARKFPDDPSIIMESNRKKAEIFIKQASCHAIDWDGLTHIMKKYKQDFVLNHERDLRFFLVDLYNRYDEENKIENDFPRTVPA